MAGEAKGKHESKRLPCAQGKSQPRSPLGWPTADLGGVRDQTMSRWIARTLVALILVMGGVLLGLSLADAETGARPVNGCVQTQATPTDGEVPEAPPPLVPEEASGLALNFLRDRDPRERQLFLKPSTEGELPATDTYLYVKRRPLVRQDVDGQIDQDAYTASVQVTGRKEVTVVVCVDPGAISLDPGTYVGSLRIEDPRVEDVTVPVTVTAQYGNYPWMLAAIGLVTLLGGSWFVWASGRRTGEKPVVGDGASKDFQGWAVANVLGIGVGAIAATSAFIATYWRDVAWGDKAPEDWFTLLGAVFTAFTAGVAAGSASIPRAAK